MGEAAVLHVRPTREQVALYLRLPRLLLDVRKKPVVYSLSFKLNSWSAVQ
jgi:hypothetical protein